jgi:drug/metabolite transporter (DMT)-like permease
VARVAILLALLSAVAYGTSDFIGGVISSRVSPWVVAFTGSAAGAVFIALIALFDHGTYSGGAVFWALAGGVGSGAGVVFLYRGLSTGRMGVVAPLSGVGSAILPAIVGLASGDRPSLLSWLGILFAIPASYLVAKAPTSGEPAKADRAGIVDGICAGVGFGLSFVAVAQLPHDAGTWPVALNMGSSAVVVAIAATIVRAPWLPRTRAAANASWCGVLGAIAIMAFQLATHHGMLTVVAVISALYPAATVILAISILREHIHRAQALGLLGCAAAVALVAAG